MIEKVVLNRQEVNKILSQCKDWVFSHVTNYSRSTEHISKGSDISTNKFVRNSFSCIVSDNLDIKNLILSKLSSFGILDISLGIAVIHYTEGCFFKRHRDGFARHKTLVIQLSDAKDYEGGELVVEDIITSKELGNAILFSAQSIHEVKKVTRGERYSLIGFLSLKDMGINEKTII